MAIYMKIDGIDGDITAKGYDKWINVKALQFAGVTNSMRDIVGKPNNRIMTKPSFGEMINIISWY